MTQAQYEEELTSDQRQALLEVYSRRPLPERWPEFLASAWTWESFGNRVVMVPWCGMVLGIEHDGHTHS